MEHIPGPWELTPEEWPDRGGYQAPEVYSVADEDNPKIVCTLAVRAEWEENGRLIAAAPDLLEALKSVNDQFSRCGTWPASVIDQVRAAIEKAKCIDAPER